MVEKVITKSRRSDRFIENDGTASEAITPGELVERKSGQTSPPQYQKHATAGGNALPIFAIEKREVGQDLDSDYSTDDTINVYKAESGDIINAKLGTGSTEVDIEINEKLESAGDGTLQKVGTAGSPEEQPAIAVAKEAVDNQSGGSEVRIKVEVL